MAWCHQSPEPVFIKVLLCFFFLFLIITSQLWPQSFCLRVIGKRFFFFLCAANPLGCGLFTVTAKKKKLCRGKNIIMGSIKPLVFSLHTRSLCACITFLQDRQASRNELKSKRCLPACFAKNTKTLLARLRRRATCGGEFNKEAVREPARGHFCRAS